MTDSKKIEIPEDLQIEYTEGLFNDGREYIRKRVLIERIAKAEAENERLESIIRAHEGEAEFSRERSILLAEALREVERMKAPVSNKEWGEYQECMRVGCDRIPTHYERATADALIANRAKPQKEDGNV